MILADLLPSRPDRRWQLARQVGVVHALAKLNPALTGERPPWGLDVLARAQRRFADAGLKLIGLEGDQFDMDRIKLGLPGRDEDLENYQRMLRNMGELGIPLLCYNFMANVGWFRTRTDIPERGGARVSGFKLGDVRHATSLEAGKVSEAAMWENYAYFVRAVLPVAEEAGVKMGLHPDDPPVSPLHGIGRILTSGDGIKQALALSKSPAHGFTFCQGSLRAAGEDLEALAREVAGRIVFIHFRDVAGTREDFRETFHDNGPTDMAGMLRLYDRLGLDVPLRVDHVPNLAGEENAEPGYGALGRLYAVGYLRGLCNAADIPLG
jgi:mannonate dehydratase